METALGAAHWLLGNVLKRLSDKSVSDYVASSMLSLNFEDIKRQLLYTEGLLHASQGKDVSNNSSLRGLLRDLSKTADEADDMLDELHYFIIQDELDGTKEAAEEVGGCLQGLALHGSHVVRHTIGNCLPCFSRWPTQDDDSASAGAVAKLSFNRVAMSNKIKSVIEKMNKICIPVSDLLKIANHDSTATSTHFRLERHPVSSIVAQDNKLHGRSVIFEQTVNTLTDGTYHGETLSVLPIVGPGGIGKTTFTQHLYNDERIQGHFHVRVWVYVSTDFDVTKLTREILSCILAIEKEQNTTTTQTTNLDQLQRSTADKLKSKRFLIVLDDIWKCNREGDWKSLLAPFTKGETRGSMVLVTTRFPSIAHLVKTTDPIELRGLEPDDFFALFEACIFGHSNPVHYEDDLIDVAKHIATKLKGSPLAANTVGRLLKKNFSREYWMGVLEKNEWQNTKYDDDIMPSLKISYDYLPFQLKKRFLYCSLFPEDHRFYDLEITSFWIAIGIPDSNDKKNCLEELVESGFLIKGYYGSREYYLMHDLMHELSRNVSSQECVNINSLSFRADDIPRSVQHLSITVEDKDDEIFGEEIGKLKSIIDIRNLRTLMIFGSHELKISNILKDTFEEIKGLRVLFIAMNNQESLPKGFSNLIHLRYLKLMAKYVFVNFDRERITLPSTLSRYYHLKFLDLQDWNGSRNLPININRLVNLSYFYSSKELHSNIPEVGKMKYLRELKEFHVEKESVGFELRQLGELRELGGKLRICNLETVASKGEASDAKLKNKRNLKQLKLVWGEEHQTVIDGDVLEGLEPPPNLRVLGIINSGAADVGPSWLLSDISIKMLETLHVEGVSWRTLPPFEQLPHLTTLRLRNISGMCVFGPGSGGVTERSLMHLKTLEIVDMPQLEEWVGGPNSPLFSRLESIECTDCPLLSSFSFLECCANLRALEISDCPKVVSQLPPMPHTCALTHMHVADGGLSVLDYDGKEMRVREYNGALGFKNMDKVEAVIINESPHVSLSVSDLQKLNSLRKLVAYGCDSIFCAVSLKELTVHDESTDEQNIPEPEPGVAISKSMNDAAGSFRLEDLDVNSISAVLIAPFCSRLAATLHTLKFSSDDRVEILTEEQEQALHLLTSLKCLEIYRCKGLRSLPRGLYRLSSLRKLSIQLCEGIQSLPPKEDLPLASLQKLDVTGCNREIKKQAKKLKETNPCLFIKVSTPYWEDDY